MKILFSSRSAWEESIRTGLQGSAHSAVFADLADVRLEEHDLVVPLTIADLTYLDTVRARIMGNPLPIPRVSSVRLCDDKLRFNQVMLAGGFGEFIPAIGKAVGFPRVLKKRFDEGGAHTYVVANPAQEQALLRGERETDYFCQELVRGEREFTTHLLFAGGRVLYALHIEAMLASATAIKGHGSAHMRRVPAPCSIGIFASMLKAAGFEGLCCVNYKLVGERPQVFEINPRFGWSMCPYFGGEVMPVFEQRAVGRLRYGIGRALHALASMPWPAGSDIVLPTLT